MIQNLSKREKILLFVVAMILILYLAIQFAIVPLYNRYFDDIDERNDLRYESSIVEMEIANISTIRQSHVSAQEQLLRIKQEYPLLIPNEEIDPILTNLCLSNGLIPSTLLFTGSFGAPVIEEEEPAPNREEKKEEPEYLLTIVTVSMNVTGSYRSLLGLLAEVDSLQYIRITNLSYAVPRQTGAPDDSRISITFELTYVNPQ